MNRVDIETREIANIECQYLANAIDIHHCHYTHSGCRENPVFARSAACRMHDVRFKPGIKKRQLMWVSATPANRDG